MDDWIIGHKVEQNFQRHPPSPSSPEVRLIPSGSKPQPSLEYVGTEVSQSVLYYTGPYYKAKLLTEDQFGSLALIGVGG